ncbi:MAG: sensor histidine kinase [Acidimicrobiia bacterium]
MRRRITEAIVGVAALILLGLGIPLAIAVHQSILDSEVVELQATAARTLAEIDVPLDPVELAAVSSETDAPPPFSVYAADGHRVFGSGPERAEPVVQRALQGMPASTVGSEIVVATPITDDKTEHIVGALRLTESLAGANHRSRVAWLIMTAVAVAALGIGWWIAANLARRLARPLSDLADAAARIGDGGTVPRQPPSGVNELDRLSDALTEASVRINDALARERRFSADVSHQLRTPLTGIRLRLESARDSHNPEAVESALDDLTRIEQTVEHLLAFARGAIPATAVLSPDDVVRRAEARWAQRARDAGRNLTVRSGEPVSARGSAQSVDQIIDVLTDNALHHGIGEIRVSYRRVTGGVAFHVGDDGHAIDERDIDRIFERGHGVRNGIGLALARSIAEAEGGRLLLTNRQPTTFTLILLDLDRSVTS